MSLVRGCNTCGNVDYEAACRRLSLAALLERHERLLGALADVTIRVPAKSLQQPPIGRVTLFRDEIADPSPLARQLTIPPELDKPSPFKWVVPKNERSVLPISLIAVGFGDRDCYRSETPEAAYGLPRRGAGRSH